MEPQRPRHYRSYLLRCWLDESAGQQRSSASRFVVEQVSSPPHRWGFDTIDDLLAFLRVEVVSPASGGDPAAERHS